MFKLNYKQIQNKYMPQGKLILLEIRRTVYFLNARKLEMRGDIYLNVEIQIFFQFLNIF
jgi:hypothetical protein